MQFLNKIYLLCLALLIIILCSSTNLLFAAESDNENNNRVLIFMLDKFELEDISAENTPFLWKISKENAIGLINASTGGERNNKNAACTISAGRHAVSSSEAHLNYMAEELVNGEKAQDIFERNLGFKLKKNNLLVNNIAIIEKNNFNRDLGTPGLLGDQLNNHNFKTAVIGNSDRPGYPSRTGVLLLMNSKGIVDNGYISDELVSADGTFYKTNYPLLLEKAELYKDNDVILVEYGDLFRLDSIYSLLFNAQYDEERKRSLKEIDKSMQDLFSVLVDSETSVYIISTSPSRKAILDSELLTPLIIIKDGFNGLLVSNSTRRDGIVNIQVLNNSILHSMGITSKERITATAHDNSLNQLMKIKHKEIFTYHNQAFIITFMVGLIIFLIFLSIFLLYKKSTYYLYPLYLILSIPISLLLISLGEFTDRNIFVFTVIILSTILSLIFIFMSKLFKVPAFMLISATTFIIISLDLFLGGQLIKDSVMSYRVLAAARYYGLGNEYLGVIIASVIFFSAYLMHHYNKNKLLSQVLLLAIFSSIIFIIAHPLLGINVGGAISALIIFGFAFRNYFYSQKINKWDFIILAIGAFFLVLIMYFIDARQAIHSHLAGNIFMLNSQGWLEAFTIIERKLLMHWGLINYSIGGWLLLLVIILLAYFMNKPFNIKNEIKQEYPYIYKFIQTAILASVTVFLFNDSGITSAALISLYLSVALIDLYGMKTLEEKKIT